MNDDLSKLTDLFEIAEPETSLNIVVNEREYEGLKGDSNNSNILYLITDGEKVGYIDFYRLILVFYDTNSIEKLENQSVKIAI